MRRDAAQKPELIRTQAQHIMEAAIGAIQVERLVQRALLAEHSGRQLVGETAIALGSPFGFSASVTSGIISGLDRAFTGVRNQRPNLVSDDVYAHPQTLKSYFNPAAFAQPEPGTYGNLKRNALTGPSYWNADLAISRTIKAENCSGALPVGSKP